MDLDKSSKSEKIERILIIVTMIIVVGYGVVFTILT